MKHSPHKPLNQLAPWDFSYQNSSCLCQQRSRTTTVRMQRGEICTDMSSIWPWSMVYMNLKLELISSARWLRIEVQGTRRANRVIEWFQILIQFSRSIVSDSLRPHGLQHARLPCPSPTPGAYSNSCPSSQWCHPTISSSINPFSSCLQSFLASGSFPMFFISGNQSIEVSASASVLPMNIQDWFPLGLTGWTSLQSKDSQESSPMPQFKRINSLALNVLYSPTLTTIHDYWKNHSLD